MIRTTAIALAATGFAVWLGLHTISGNSVEARMTQDVLVSGVSRFGINLGGWSFWGADQLMSNIVKNPGFEGLIDGAIVIPEHIGSNVFDDSPPWLARPEGFWEGARYSIRSGIGAGKGGTIALSSRKGLWGLPSFVALAGGAIPFPGDAVAMVKERDGKLPCQWWYSKDAGNSFRPELNDRRPGSPGVRSLRIIAESSPATVASYFDSIGQRAGKMLPLTGTWNLSFWAKLDRGAASLHVVFGRQGSTAILSRDVPVSHGWQNVHLTFSGEDDGPIGTVNLLFQVTGAPSGEILLDDVDLRRTEDLNQPFRHEVFSVLSQLHPAYLRDWQGQLGDTLANRTAAPFARKSYRYRPGDDSQTDFGYGLRDFLDLCVRLQASPWIIVPTVFNDSECAGLGDYLAQQKDLAQVREVLVEFGNENWNSLFRPAGIPNPQPHGEASGRCFAAIQSHAGRLPLKTVINAQAGYPDGAIRFARASEVSDIVAVAPYFFYSLPRGLSLADRIAILFKSDRADLEKIASNVAPLHKEMAIYEVNLHNTEGDASAGERRPVVGGMPSGTALARTMLDALALGIRRQCAYTLVGFDSQLASQPGYVPLWGMIRDLGPTQRLRPTGLAFELMNEAIRGDMVRIDIHGAKDVKAYGFKSGQSWTVIFVSSSPSDRMLCFTPLPDTLDSSSVSMNTLVSDASGADNEDGEHVRIQRTTVGVTGHSICFDLRPWSIAVLLPSKDRK
jgi:hypothetical protein